MKVEIPPQVVFTKEAYFRMMQYCRLTETEVTGFGTVLEDGNALIVREVFIVPQIATNAGVQVDGKALLDFMKWAKEQDREDLIGTSKLWWHSHAAFGVFRSQTDNDTIDMLLGLQPYVLAVVGNHKAQYECSLHYQKPRSSFTNLRIIQEDFSKDQVTEQVRQDIKDMVKEWKKPVVNEYRPPVSPTKTVVDNTYRDRAMEIFSAEDYEESKLAASEVRPAGKGSIYQMTDEEFSEWVKSQGLEPRGE